MEDCLPFHSLNLLFHSILASSIFHTKISVPFHFIPCPGCRFYIIIIIATFYATVVARLKIRKRLTLKKLLPLPAPFQHFRFRVRFRFQPLSSKCFCFLKNLTASASSFRFRFHIPCCDYFVGSQLFMQIACLNEFGSQKKIVEKHCVKPLKSQLLE